MPRCFTVYSNICKNNLYDQISKDCEEMFAKMFHSVQKHLSKTTYPPKFQNIVRKCLPRCFSLEPEAKTWRQFVFSTERPPLLKENIGFQIIIRASKRGIDHRPGGRRFEVKNLQVQIPTQIQIQKNYHPCKQKRN